MHSDILYLCKRSQQLLLLARYAHTQSQLLLSASLQLLLLLPLNERRHNSKTALLLPLVIKATPAAAGRSLRDGRALLSCSLCMAASPKLIAVQDDVLMYGGRGGEETRPQFVLTDWHVASEFMKDFNGFVSNVVCWRLPALLLGRWNAEHRFWVCTMLPEHTHSCCILRQEGHCDCESAGPLRPAALLQQKSLASGQQSGPPVCGCMPSISAALQEEYSKVDLQVECADGSKSEKPGELRIYQVFTLDVACFQGMLISKP